MELLSGKELEKQQVMGVEKKGMDGPKIPLHLARECPVLTYARPSMSLSTLIINRC